MCGIFGYVGQRDAATVVIEGLRRLEYRGYDSAGVAAIGTGGMALRKTAGKIDALAALLASDRAPGGTAIAHTRWATHGVPSKDNAHPHTGCLGRIAIVHNGIIENFEELRSRLAAEGHTFRSTTDSEVIAHLIESDADLGLDAAVRRAIESLSGAYALAAVDAASPGEIVVASRECPLVVGIGEGETFVASDAIALIPETRRMVFLEQGDIARLTADGITVAGADGTVREPTPTAIDWDAARVEKGGYAHFMLKEVFEQPWAIRETLRDRIDLAAKEVRIDEAGLDGGEIDRVAIVACGTSLHAGMIGRNMIERTARLPVQVENASDFRYRDPVVDGRTLVIPITQSGETADTLGALREARERGTRILSICNVEGSTIAREADAVLYTRAGPEIGVASTKAFTTQMVVLYLIAIRLGRLRGTLSQEDARRRIRDLLGAADRALGFLESSADSVERVALRYASATNALYLGRGSGFPLALEGALKLKEVSYIHAEGYHAAEMKHGPIALIDPEMPVVVLALRGRRYPKIRANIEEVRARGGRIIAIASKGDDEIARVCDDVIHLRAESGIMNSVLAAIPLQLLAYHIAVARGCDVDQPRNLAKSVTVE